VDDDAMSTKSSKGTLDEVRLRASQVRQALFAAIEGGADEDDDDGEENLRSHRALVKLFESAKEYRKIIPGATARQVKDLIFDTVSDFHKGHARRLFAGLKPIVERVCNEDIYYPQSLLQDDDMTVKTADDRTLDPDEIEPDERSSEALSFLHYTSRMLQTHLDAVVERYNSSRRKSHIRQSIPMMAEAFDVARLLHSILLNLHECGPDALPVQNSMLNLFESWWLNNLEERESLILGVLPVLVYRALRTDNTPPTKADVKRLLTMQDAFQVIDLEDEASENLRTSLLKVASSPLCLKLSEGRRFIAGLFLLEPTLVTELHQAIRIQIPEAKRPTLEAYGEIYKRAWKESQSNYDCPEEIRNAIEQDVVQDLMEAILHMQNAKMTSALLVVLEPFHEAKKSTEIEGLLHRLYGPILWRALSATNPQVRINAARILGEVFPLHEPSHVHPEADFTRAAEAVKALLLDGCHQVRVAAAEVAAKVLVTYWDVLSTENIRMMLTSKLCTCTAS
jgi:condensin-2 complex subunit G2